MRGPYTVGLHPDHPDGLEPSEGEPCDVAYVMGFDEDGTDIEICTVFRDGSKEIAQHIADLLTDAELRHPKCTHTE